MKQPTGNGPLGQSAVNPSSTIQQSYEIEFQGEKTNPWINCLTWVAIPFVILLLPLIILILVILLIELKINKTIQYWKSPTPCCRCNCKRCPWGNKRLKKYRKQHQNDIDRPRVTEQEYTQTLKTYKSP